MVFGVCLLVVMLILLPIDMLVVVLDGCLVGNCWFLVLCLWYCGCGLAYC